MLGVMVRRVPSKACSRQEQARRVGMQFFNLIQSFAVRISYILQAWRA